MVKTGIYKYENNINHKIYIGQSIDIDKRIREHKNGSFNPNNKDYNLSIHKAIRKYGLNSFTIDIIEICSKEQLNEREQYWIEYYNSYYNGYNATKGGQEGGYNGKPVEVYDLNGKYLTTYNNAKEAAQKLGVSYSTIQQVLHGKRPTCKKRQLKYQSDSKTIKRFQSRQGGKIPIIQLSKSNEFIQEWESAAAAARFLNLDSSCITKCLKHKLQTHGGFKWRYKEELLCDTQI